MFPVCFRNTGVVFRGVFAGKGKRILEQEREVCMKNRISDETVAYIGILAKLELSEEERKRAGNDMANMLDYMEGTGYVRRCADIPSFSDRKCVSRGYCDKWRRSERCAF